MVIWLYRGDRPGISCIGSFDGGSSMDFQGHVKNHTKEKGNG